jgi:hypothetical protein
MATSSKADNNPYYYLEPDFDARKLTIHQLTSILSFHSVPVPSVAQRKAVYVELFQKRIQDRAGVLKKELKSVRPSSEGIEFVDRQKSGTEVASDENVDPHQGLMEVKKRSTRLRKIAVKEPPKSPEDKNRHFKKEEEEDELALMDEKQDLVVIKKPRVNLAGVTQHSTSPLEKPPLHYLSSLKRASARLSLEEERPLPTLQKSPPPPSLDKFRIQPTLPGIRDTVRASPVVQKMDSENEYTEEGEYSEEEEEEMDLVGVDESQSFMMHQDQLMTRDMPLQDMMDVLKDMAEHSDFIDEGENPRDSEALVNSKQVQLLTLKSLGQWMAMSLLAFLTIWVLFMTPVPTLVAEWTLSALGYTRFYIQSMVSSHTLVTVKKAYFLPTTGGIDSDNTKVL